MSTATLNTTLTKKKSGSETSNLVLAYLTSIGEIGIESEERDVTTHDSLEGFREVEAGLKDAGELSFAGITKTDVQNEKLLALAASQSLEEWTVTFPTGAKWDFKGFVKSFKDGEKTPDGTATFSGTIRISGKPTYTKAPESPPSGT